MSLFLSLSPPPTNPTLPHPWSTAAGAAPVVLCLYDPPSPPMAVIPPNTCTTTASGQINALLVNAFVGLISEWNVQYVV